MIVSYITRRIHVSWSTSYDGFTVRVAEACRDIADGVRRILPPMFVVLVAAASPGNGSAQDAISFDGVGQLRPVELVAEFGQVEGPRGVFFSRVYDARFVGDSAVAVTDAYRAAIVVLDICCGTTREIGRAGGGPGEFTGTPYLGIEEHQRIPAWDPGAGRMSWFGPGGALLAEASLGSAQMARLPNSRTVRAWQVDGGLILAATGAQRREEGWIVSEVQPTLVDPVQGAVWSVGPTLLNRAPMEGGIYVQSPWTPFGVVALWNNEVVVADTAGWTLSFYDQAGLVRQIRSQVDRPELDAAGINEVNSAFEGYYGKNPLMMGLFESIEPPTKLPVIGGLRPSSDGRLLVTRFRPLDTGPRLVVDVLDAQMEPAVQVVLPGEYSRVLDMKDDLVLALTQGAFDVPLLRVLRVGGGDQVGG